METTVPPTQEKERDPYGEIDDICKCIGCEKWFMNLYKIRFQNWQGQMLPIRIGRCGHCQKVKT
jgi:hypothetical protein